MILTSPLGQQALGGQVTRLIHCPFVLSVLGLDGVRGQQDSRLWRAVDLLCQNVLLHLQEEKPPGDVLDQLLAHILGVELGPQLELQGSLPLHALDHHLRKVE